MQTNSSYTVLPVRFLFLYASSSELIRPCPQMRD